MTPDDKAALSLTLIVRRTIDGDPDAVFHAWTDPEQVRQWWGPAGIRCTECAVDLRVGGAYRIANRLPDGSVLWIAGEFLRVEPPRLLEYTWRRGLETPADPQSSERVTVRFVATAGGSEVIVEHTRIADHSIRDRHEAG
ncbi:MAG: SRPBCC domain-containing protein, partial [Inquilinus sp.]|nr:SRPBCC domain-containing protein [Inquilinus sp.]